MERWVYKLIVGAFLCLGGSLIDTQAGAGSITTAPEQTSDAKERNRDSLQPTPELSPADVVRIQIEALGQNDIPRENAGIEITFRFASPANKSVTGPLERFIQLVHNPVYRPMLNHRKAEYGTIQIEEDLAVQLVILTARNGERAGYFFSLSKQQGGRYEACWMTDAVIRFEIPDEQNGSLAI